MNKIDTELSELEISFNALYTTYHSTKVRSYEDKLVYHSIPFGYSQEIENELNEIITRVGLPLIAKRNSSANGMFFDTVCVTSINEK